MRYDLKFELTEPQWLQNPKKPQILPGRSGAVKATVKNVERVKPKSSSKERISLESVRQLGYVPISETDTLFAPETTDGSKTILMILRSGLIRLGQKITLRFSESWDGQVKGLKLTGTRESSSSEVLRKESTVGNSPSKKQEIWRQITKGRFSWLDVVVVIILVRVGDILLTHLTISWK